MRDFKLLLSMTAALVFGLYLSSPSIALALERLSAASHQGRVVKDAHDTPWDTREAILEDPDGHRIY